MSGFITQYGLTKALNRPEYRTLSSSSHALTTVLQAYLDADVSLDDCAPVVDALRREHGREGLAALRAMLTSIGAKVAAAMIDPVISRMDAAAAAAAAAASAAAYRAYVPPPYVAPTYQERKDAILSQIADAEKDRELDALARKLHDVRSGRPDPAEEMARMVEEQVSRRLAQAEDPDVKYRRQCADLVRVIESQYGRDVEKRVRYNNWLGKQQKQELLRIYRACESAAHAGQLYSRIDLAYATAYVAGLK